MVGADVISLKSGSGGIVELSGELLGVGAVANMGPAPFLFDGAEGSVLQLNPIRAMPTNATINR
jgi:hypothetical protein